MLVLFSFLHNLDDNKRCIYIGRGILVTESKNMKLYTNSMQRQTAKCRQIHFVENQRLYSKLFFISISKSTIGTGGFSSVYL